MLRLLLPLMDVELPERVQAIKFMVPITLKIPPPPLELTPLLPLAEVELPESVQAVRYIVPSL